MTEKAHIIGYSEDKSMALVWVPLTDGGLDPEVVARTIAVVRTVLHPEGDTSGVAQTIEVPTMPGPAAKPAPPLRTGGEITAPISQKQAGRFLSISKARAQALGLKSLEVVANGALVERGVEPIPEGMTEWSDMCKHVAARVTWQEHQYDALCDAAESYNDGSQPEAKDDFPQADSSVPF